MHNRYLALAIATALTGCGGGGGSTTTASTNTTTAGTSGTPATARDSTAYPKSLVVSSPFAVESTTPLADIAADLPLLAARLEARAVEPVAPQRPLAGRVPGYTAAIDHIDKVLDGKAELRDHLSPQLFFRNPRPVDCYGPTLAYQNHPDGTDPPPQSGQAYPTLPGGDLGIWKGSENDGTACSAAKLNALMDRAGAISKAAMLIVAGMLDAAADSGRPLPDKGARLDLKEALKSKKPAGVEFSEVSVERSATEGVLNYKAVLSVSRGSTTVEGIEVTLKHAPGTAGDEAYKGLLTWKVPGQPAGGNCGSEGSTRLGSLVYERTASTALNLHLREGGFCGQNVTGGFAGDGQVDPTYTKSPSRADGWGDGFDMLTANYNPKTLAGRYAFAWQAGMGDSHSRVFNVTVNNHNPLDGEAWFGFGDALSNGGKASIKGMICNWAGPGNSHALQPYAQRQFIRYDETSGVFAEVRGGSDITYAPTNSCTYEGGGSFDYDRDLDAALGDGDLVNVVKSRAAGTGELDFDLFPASDTTYASMTLPEAMSARGFTAPTAPTATLP